MSYIKRTGSKFSIKNSIVFLIFLITMLIKTDWIKQYEMFNQFSSISVFSNDSISIIFIYVVLSLVISILWYPIAKLLGPSVGIILARFYGGVGSQLFLDKEIKKKRVGIVQFILRYLNLSVSLFALDFLLTNSIFSNIDPYPPFQSFLLSMLIVSLVQPMNYALEDIGLRLFQDSSNQISSITSLLDRFFFKFIQTSSLIGSIAIVSLNSTVIDDIPVQIRVIFVRNFFISLLLTYFYTSLFQTEPIKQAWKKRNIPEGKIKINL